jgi:hypothetical protein
MLDCEPEHISGVRVPASKPAPSTILRSPVSGDEAISSALIDRDVFHHHRTERTSDAVCGLVEAVFTGRDDIQQINLQAGAGEQRSDPRSHRFCAGDMGSPARAMMVSHPPCNVSVTASSRFGRALPGLSQPERHGHFVEGEDGRMRLPAKIIRGELPPIPLLASHFPLRKWPLLESSPDHDLGHL